MHPLESVINKWFAQRHQISPQNAPAELRKIILQIISSLDQGVLRVAEKIEGVWHTHEWIKKTVLLFFLISENKQYDVTSVNRHYDKIPTKFINWDQDQFSQSGIRVVPGAIVRQGAYIAKNTILMPSYTNIGAYIDEGTMVDSWVTVGSCAQIGKQVHLSSSVVIGGVLEPLQASPTIIEDNCFIGACSVIVEGVIVEEGSVISTGVSISQSTRIYDRKTQEITYGRIPAGSVVVPGYLPAKDNQYGVYCAVIVKKVDAKTRSKISINELLREL